MRSVSDTDLAMRRQKVKFKLRCPAPPGIEPIAALEDGEGRVTKGNTSNDMGATDKSETRTFGEIGSQILVQLIKVGFGDDNGVQRRVIGTLVWRTPWLERAVLIVGNSRISSRSRGGRGAG